MRVRRDRRHRSQIDLPAFGIGPVQLELVAHAGDQVGEVVQILARGAVGETESVGPGKGFEEIGILRHVALEAVDRQRAVAQPAHETVRQDAHALMGIGAAGQATIDKVAGPIGEALIMTALGLAVAIPAVLGYNALVRGNKFILTRLHRFSHDLHAYFVTGARVGAASPADGKVVAIKKA